MASSTSRSDIDEDRFFFGKITSEEADEILLKEGGEEGTFLIRESCSSAGNYVLSFIADSKPIHILIQKYKGDAYFSLVVLGVAPVFHGLDSLVAHYTQFPVGPSTTILTHPCPGNPFPPNVCLHGSSSLLHRSTSQGNMVVVSELLKSGYKKIDVKNTTGQTALHIACSKGYKEITQMLIEHQANVEVRDEEGVTPLHLACRYNKPDVVQLLVEMGQADMQARATETGCVALHEATEHNSVECVKKLLAMGAPANPNNSVHQTPASIAKTKNHLEVYNLLGHLPHLQTCEEHACDVSVCPAVNHKPRVPQYTLRDYFHGNLDRGSAQDLLLSAPCASSGYFLLRYSSRRHLAYVLSLLYKKQVYNFEIIKEHNGMFCIDDGPYFPSLETLVDHYLHFVDGLPCCLTTPIAPSQGEDTSSSRSPLLPLSSRQSSTENVESPEVHLTPCHSRAAFRTSPQLSMDHLDHSRIPSRHSSCSFSKEYGSCEDDNFSSSEFGLMASSQEDLKPQHYGTQPPQQPDIIVTRSLSRVSHDLIDLNNSEKAVQCTPGSNSVPRSKPAALSLDLQNLHMGNEECGSSPTMDGNRTCEIFGEIDSNHLTFGEELGCGEFGSVYRGKWLSPSGDQIDVAIKTLHEDSDVENFLKEARVMMNLNHLYIVKLVGVCHSPPIAMVQELMGMGSLLDNLLDHEDKISVDFHHKLWAAQIAEGMMYLEQKHFVHCDLAARNILLSSMTLAKISDFGLSRALSVDKDYYTCKEGGKWPLKWYAPESIYYGTFTHNSDVWSYGVTLWEMYTFGNQPYGEIPGKDVVALLERNERLPKPEKCPKGVYELMRRCWDYRPKERPSFRELATIFRTFPEYINIKPYFK